MTSIAWLFDILAALMLVVMAVSAIRLATAGLPTRRLSVAGPIVCRSLARGSNGADIDIAHLLMGIAMAGMLAPSVKTLPPYAWETIFSLLTVWFAWRLAGDAKMDGVRALVGGHRAVHLSHCAAMVYMLTAVTTPDGMDICAADGGMALQYRALARAFAFPLVCYCVWDLFGQLSGQRHSLRGAPKGDVAQTGNTAPTVGCRFVMGVTMTFMLLYPMP